MDFPNAWIFLHGVYNYSRGFGFIWNEIAFTVTFRSDWEAARDLMLARAEETSNIVAQQAKRQIRRMSRDYLVHYGILTPFVYVQITERGVRLTLRYLCEVRKRRGTAHALTMSLLEDFQQARRHRVRLPDDGRLGAGGGAVRQRRRRGRAGERERGERAAAAGGVTGKRGRRGEGKY